MLRGFRNKYTTRNPRSSPTAESIHLCSCMSSHWNRRRRTTFVWVLGHIGWRRHHHMIRHGVLQLRALVIVWMSMCRNRRRRHRRSWACSIRWRIWSRRWRAGHIGLWGWHLSHARRVHGSRGRHSRRILHRLHIRTMHIGAWRSGGCHSWHHRLTRITVRRVGVDIATSSGLCCRVLLV